MQVACGECGAKYEFESSAIPAEGYDAQCVHCGNVFFVAPEGGEALISVTCSSCKTVYEFPPSAIPEGGYDAQCTQCQAVFFVSASPGSPGARGAALPVTASAPPVSATAAVRVPPAPRAAAPEGAAAAPSVPPLPEHDPDLALAATPGGDDLELELAAAAGGGRTRLLLVGGVAVGLAALVAGVCFLAPSVFDATLGRVLGVRLTVPAEAQAGLERARALIWADAPGACEQALAELERVLVANPDWPDALALQSLARIFHGLDGRAEADRLRAEAALATKELEAPPPPRPAGKAAAKAAAAAEAERAKALRAKITDLEAKAKAAFDAADKEFDQAFAVLSAASKAHPQSAAVALAAGFYYARDASVSGTGEEMLARSVELQAGHQASLDLAKPPDGLTAYLRAALWARQPGERKRVRDALEAALTKDPGLQRARLDLALELDRAADRDGARRILKELLGAVPTHARATALLAAWDAPPPAPAVTAAPPAADDAATQPKAKKKKKGKRAK